MRNTWYHVRDAEGCSVGSAFPTPGGWLYGDRHAEVAQPVYIHDPGHTWSAVERDEEPPGPPPEPWESRPPLEALDVDGVAFWPHGAPCIATSARVDGRHAGLWSNGGGWQVGEAVRAHVYRAWEQAAPLVEAQYAARDRETAARETAIRAALGVAGE